MFLLFWLNSFKTQSYKMQRDQMTQNKHGIDSFDYPADDNIEQGYFTAAISKKNNIFL